MAPEFVLRQWDIGIGSKNVKISRETSGIFNETYKITSHRDILILQKLHPLISNPGATANYARLTEFLAGRAYPAQVILRAKAGNFLVPDGKRSWRLMRGVPGTVFNKAPGAAMVKEAGRMLGLTHVILGEFKGRLAPALPMFQYGKVLRKLRRYRSRFLKDKDRRVKEAAEFLLKNLPKRFLPKGLPRRLIHTDPKISNFVFDRRGTSTTLSAGKAVAMIDFDTAQKLSPLYDIGDALRSFCGEEEDNPENRFDAKNAKAFLAGYFLSAGGYLSGREKALIRQATALVMLGLASRFLNDYIDDSYFGWDRGRYSSRRQHNLARVLGQIALYKDFLRKTKV